METTNIIKPNYKIFHFGKSKYDRIVDEKFYAKDDNEAYSHLIDFKSKTLARDSITFYYGRITYVYSTNANGKISQAYDIEDHRSRMAWFSKDLPWYSRAYDEVKSFLSYWLVDRPKDFYYWTRDLVYLLKNKEAYSNQWNLDYHILDSIERNVPSLIENSHSLAFIDEAITTIHGHDPNFSLAKYHEQHCCGYPKEIEDLAVKIQKEEYHNLLLYVRLYKYYSSFGDIDFNNPKDVAFDRTWRHTLPIKKGTYDEISDYDKLLAMSKEYWNKIWDWMKMYGDKLND